LPLADFKIRAHFGDTMGTLIMYPF